MGDISYGYIYVPATQATNTQIELTHITLLHQQRPLAPELQNFTGMDVPATHASNK